MSSITKGQTDTTTAAQQPASFQFLPPGNINDFPGNSDAYKQLLQLWNQNLSGFSEQAKAGNTWNNLNTPAPPNYYNPAFTMPPSTPTGTFITWSPFPGRFQTYYGPNSTTPLSEQQMQELADTGYYTVNNVKHTFPNITATPCTAFDSKYFPSGSSCGCAGNPASMIPYGPYGPRGWQDEYCEWSVTRDTGNSITRIDITCENPEYWNSLWLVSPERVLELYRSTLGNKNIQLEDLQLHHPGGLKEPVIDPGTGRPAYNPLNKWNSGPATTATGGGAMHLTSTPNTLQTEIGLAAAATVPRNYPNNGGKIPPGDIQTLVCSAQYGQYGRNSDPNIGAGVYRYGANGNAVTLFNPPGLYIQLPNLNSTFSIPGVNDISPYFVVSRGGETVNVGGQNFNLNLHVTIQAPANMPPLSKMLVNGKPLQWASQIIQTFNMVILAQAIPGQQQTPLACSTPATTGLHAQPLQLFHYDIFNAMYTTAIANPVNFNMNLLSNSTYVAPTAIRGRGYRFIITYQPAVDISFLNPADPSTWPTVTFDDPQITVKVTGLIKNITYAVPGNSYPSSSVALIVTLEVNNNAVQGLHGIRIKDARETGNGPIMPSMLHIK